MHTHRDRTAELYRSFGTRVYRRCLRLLDDEEAAQDATQEVFLKLVVNISRLQDREQLLPWMMNVARNHCLNVRRAARHVASLTDEMELEEPASSTDVTRAVLARSLLDRADPTVRRVVYAVLAAGFEHEDAAAALGLSPAAVARKVQRFLASAREHLTQSEYLEASGRTGGKATSRAQPQVAPALAAAPVPVPAPATTAPPRPEPVKAARDTSPGSARRRYLGDDAEPAAA